MTGLNVEECLSIVFIQQWHCLNGLLKINEKIIIERRERGTLSIGVFVHTQTPHDVLNMK